MAHARVAEWNEGQSAEYALTVPEAYGRGGNIRNLGRHHYEVKNAPEERKSYWHIIDYRWKRLSEKGPGAKFYSLHDTVQAVHQNYFRAEEQITSNLQNALKDLLFTRSDRRYKLKAWRLLKE